MKAKRGTAGRRWFVVVDMPQPHYTSTKKGGERGAREPLATGDIPERYLLVTVIGIVKVSYGIVLEDKKLATAVLFVP